MGRKHEIELVSAVLNNKNILILPLDRQRVPEAMLGFLMFKGNDAFTTAPKIYRWRENGQDAYGIRWKGGASNYAGAQATTLKDLCSALAGKPLNEREQNLLKASLRFSAIESLYYHDDLDAINPNTMINEKSKIFPIDMGSREGFSYESFVTTALATINAAHAISGTGTQSFIHSDSPRSFSESIKLIEKSDQCRHFFIENFARPVIDSIQRLKLESKNIQYTTSSDISPQQKINNTYKSIIDHKLRFLSLDQHGKLLCDFDKIKPPPMSIVADLKSLFSFIERCVVKKL